MVKFRTKYNCVINDGETFEQGTSLVQPGRSESLQHLVQRLTRKPNPTTRDILRVAPDVEDAESLTPLQIESRFDETVSLGDRVDVIDAIFETEDALGGDGANPVSGSENEQNVVNASLSGTQTGDLQVPAPTLASESTKAKQ